MSGIEPTDTPIGTAVGTPFDQIITYDPACPNCHGTGVGVGNDPDGNPYPDPCAICCVHPNGFWPFEVALGSFVGGCFRPNCDTYFSLFDWNLLPPVTKPPV